MKLSKFRFVTLSLSMLAICCTSAMAAQQPATAVVKFIKGSAYYTDSKGLTHPAVVGSTLPAGSTLSTGPESTVDLLFPETRATLGLGAESTLQFERLAYRDSEVGRVTDTLLKLTRGELISTVGKQSAGSTFLVETAKSTTSVRGTEFYVEASTGDVHVLSGTVEVTLVINVNTDPAETLNHMVIVGAGQSLTVPQTFASEAIIDSLTATDTKWLTTPRVSQWFERQNRRFNAYPETEGSDYVQIRETFVAEARGGGNIWLVRPPTVDLISY